MIVVDASVVIDCLTGEAGAQLRRDISSAGDLHAPHLLDYEALNALRGMHRAGHLSHERVQTILHDLVRMPVERHPLGAMSLDAWLLRHNVSAYDAAYVSLAQTLDTPLWTRDLRLARAAANLVDIVTA